MPLVPTPKNCDASVKKAIQILTQKLGLKSVPNFASITLNDLTASSLVGTNASKLLESVTIGLGLDYTRPTLKLSHLGIQDLTDPNADKILFWDDSATASAWLGVGNSIAITTTTIDTIQDIRTSASPQFTGIELGHATDTTITRASAGNLNIEGNIIYRAGGTDVPLTDGGTGASSAVDARTNLGLVIGTDVQAFGAVLDDLSALTPPASDGQFIVATGAGAFAYESGATVRTSIGLGNVEDTALSTWAGSANITTLGTITTVGNITIAGDGTIGQAAGPLLKFDNTNNFLEISGCKVGINTTDPIGDLQIEGSAYPVIRGVRTTAATAGVGATLDFLFRTSGDMIDGFGGGVTASIQDDTAGPFFIAGFYGRRTGADNSGSFCIYTLNAGNFTEKMRVLPGGGLAMIEQAAAGADVATYGQIWVKSDTPNILMFTDDAGTDFTINVTAV